MYAKHIVVRWFRNYRMINIYQLIFQVEVETAQNIFAMRFRILYRY